MRDLTPEQLELLIFINTPEYLARKAKEQAEEKEAMERAKAIAEANRAHERAKYEQQKREREETVRPLKEAMRAAGIKLYLTSYEGVWGSYQIGDGPEVDLDLDYFEVD